MHALLDGGECRPDRLGRVDGQSADRLRRGSSRRGATSRAVRSCRASPPRWQTVWHRSARLRRALAPAATMPPRVAARAGPTVNADATAMAEQAPMSARRPIVRGPLGASASSRLAVACRRDDATRRRLQQPREPRRHPRRRPRAVTARRPMIRCIHHQPATFSTAPDVTAASPAGGADGVAHVRIGGREEPEHADRHERHHPGRHAVPARSASAAPRLIAFRSRSVAATRSSGAAAGPPTSAQDRSTVSASPTAVPESAGDGARARCPATDRDSASPRSGRSRGRAQGGRCGPERRSSATRRSGSSRATSSHHAATSRSVAAGRDASASMGDRAPVGNRRRAPERSMSTRAGRGSRRQRRRRVPCPPGRSSWLRSPRPVQRSDDGAVLHDDRAWPGPRPASVTATASASSAISTTRRAPPAGALDVNDRVDAPVEVTAHGGERPCRRRLQHERLEPVHGVAGAVRVARRQRAVVAGVERLHEPEHLRCRGPRRPRAGRGGGAARCGAAARA